jgi:hypothetical protein
LCHWTVSINYVAIYIRTYKQKEDFYSVDQFHDSALHDDVGAACREEHTDFADESACLTAGNIKHEIVIIHRSQGMLKTLSLYT